MSRSPAHGITITRSIGKEIILLVDDEVVARIGYEGGGRFRIAYGRAGVVAVREERFHAATTLVDRED